MDLPDDPSQLPGWLERHLMGLDLAALVAELEAVHGPPTDPVTTVRAWLEDQLDPVLERGLMALSTGMLVRLLRQPRLLLQLQELILLSGGDYWDRVASSMRPMDGHVECVGRRLETFVTSEGRPERPQAERPLRLPMAWYRRPWLLSMSAAASVLVAILVYDRSRPRANLPVAAAANDWGWNKPPALSQDVLPAAYLNRLADEAQEWFQKRPDDPIALARRITEFRAGCAALILRNHPALAAGDQAWLVGKCRVWAAEFDRYLAALESGSDPLRVRAEADRTVTDLIEMLRTRPTPVS